MLDNAEAVIEGLHPQTNILLCWGYHRKGWVFPFEELKGQFNFTYLFYVFHEEENSVFTDCPRIYWSKFKSAHEIIDLVKPELILFMSLDSSYPISLNYAAKKRGISTAIFQHGLFRTYQEYLQLEVNDKKSGLDVQHKIPALKSPGLYKSFYFLVKSLGLNVVLYLPGIVRFFFIKRRIGPYHAIPRLSTKLKTPSKFICFTPKNATVYREVYSAKEANICYTGIPELDPYFRGVINSNTRSPYFLLIDQPFAENQYYDFGVDVEDANRGYEKLANWCSRNNSKLLIKLHPESYGSTWLLHHQNIEYVRDTDMPALLAGATGVFGSTSTLMLPALYFKPVFFLLIQDSIFQKEIIEMGIAKGADYHNFQEEEIIFVEKPERVIEPFVHQYLFAADGYSIRRLSQCLQKIVE